MKIYGKDGIDENTIRQMEAALDIPVAVAGALMPDAHLGYGLPIGGVLATRGAVIPYAVGVDIACRMRLSIVELNPDGEDRAELIAALENGTKFGTGQQFDVPQEHKVMDDPAWDESDLLSDLKKKATHQLGTSGSGNHFVEWGIVNIHNHIEPVRPGTYLGLLSHSGSRGPGATVCHHFTKLAKEQNPAGELSWLNLDSQEGQDYWKAMNLMGRYAAANHEVIHRRVLARCGRRPLGVIENHHNFAWKEIHDDEEVIVHRKGATPADQDVLGIIPGSMASPGFIVEGKAATDSLRSASHGAGRLMSRKQAKKMFNWEDWHRHLEGLGIELLSGDLDEVPAAYKNIWDVMDQQRELVKIVGMFSPKIVKMAP